MQWNGNFLNFQRKETRRMYETKSSAGQKLESASEGEKAALSRVHSPWTRLEKGCARNALSTCCGIERCPFSLVNVHKYTQNINLYYKLFIKLTIHMIKNL